MPDASRPIGTLHFDTALLPPEGRFDAWRNALTNFDLSRREAEPFAAVADVWMLGPLILTRASVDPLRYDRSRQRIAADSNDHLAMVYLLSGGFVGDYGAGEIASGAGSLTILDMCRPCWTDAERLEAFIISAARPLVVPRIGAAQPHGLVATGAAATLLGAVLRDVADNAPSLTQDHAPALTTVICELLVRTIVEASPNTGASSRRDDTLVSRVRLFIDANLDRDLDAAMICTALGVSRSALYRAFEAGGGVHHQIQRRRILRLRACLDASDGRSIGGIIATLGFADKSHATRLFKKEFGCTPGAYRATRETAKERAYAGVDAPKLFETWTSTLD